MHLNGFLQSICLALRHDGEIGQAPSPHQIGCASLTGNANEWAFAVPTSYAIFGGQ